MNECLAFLSCYIKKCVVVWGGVKLDRANKMDILAKVMGNMSNIFPTLYKLRLISRSSESPFVIWMYLPFAIIGQLDSQWLPYLKLHLEYKALPFVQCLQQKILRKAVRLNDVIS